jgi:hypothetical protein
LRTAERIVREPPGTVAWIERNALSMGDPRVRSRLALSVFVVLLCAALASCKDCGGPEPKKDAAPSASVPSATTSVAPPVEAAAPPPLDAATTSAADATVPGDGGVSSCRLAYGPAEQPFRGPASMLASGTELRLVANDSGKPKVYTIAITPPPAKGAPPVVPPPPASFVGMRWPACEVAGHFAYCQAPGGLIYRTTLGMSDTKQIAKSKSGTRIAAASVGNDHSVVAYLEAHVTTEGQMLQAFAVLDVGEPVRLSEDGAGATTLRVVARGDHAIASYLDTRTAMVPLHARPIRAKANGDIQLGADSVLFVGGAPERGVDLTLAQTAQKLFVLVPLPRDAADFGMAAVEIRDPPADNVGAVWSPYPNGLDPAPIAAAPAAGGAGPAWVARMRTRERAPSAPRVLELGRLDDAGAFTSLGVIMEGKRVTDVAIVADAPGSVWILYGDSTATWLERRVCP